jgi:hypothetical protein
VQQQQQQQHVMKRSIKKTQKNKTKQNYQSLFV